MVKWSDENFLVLNVSKTKEIVIDFRTKPSPIQPLVIKGEAVERVHEYKYLGTILDDKLDWTLNTDAIVSKGNQRLHFLRKLRSFDVSRTIIQLFYKATLESVLTFNSLCHYNQLKVIDSERLARIIKSAGIIIGNPVCGLKHHYDKKCLKRALAIQADATHPLCPAIKGQKSLRDPEVQRTTSAKMRSCDVRTKRHFVTFVPTTVRLLNGTRGSPTDM